jgi:hypothetical protein
MRGNRLVENQEDEEGKAIMIGWKDEKRWSDRFIPHIKALLAPYVIGEANIDDDERRNTDLILLRATVHRIACRVRRPGYASKYPGEITIRADRPSGTKTELHKIIEGWGDFLFYGHAAEWSDEIISWIICDLTKFRSWFFYQICDSHGRVPGVLHSNRDGSSRFRVFQVSEIEAFSKGFIVAENSFRLEVAI